MIQLSAPTPFIGGLYQRQLRDAGHASAEVSLNGASVQVSGVTDEADAARILTAHPATAQAEIDRMGGEQSNETTIRDKAAAALDTNKTFLAVTSPTNAQILAQVKALTRQNNGLIRLVLRRLDGTD